ncbi:MAG: CRTAC1 family protein [Planctomycetaceae bacterium]|nr:CRTAC1 family protein [Planctomycetaceae bacterium]
MERQKGNVVGIGVTILVIAVAAFFVFSNRQDEKEAEPRQEPLVAEDTAVEEQTVDPAPVNETFIDSGSALPKETTRPGGDRVIDVAAIGEFAEERKKLDETVWSDEVTAQKFEEPFIDLWDRIRASEDKIHELTEFTFADLTLSMPGEPTRHDHMIDAFTCDNGTMTFDQEQWKSWLSDWQHAGLKMIQAEFHHSRFHPDEESPSSSVSFVLDLTNSSEETNYNVRGMIDVVWEPLASESDQPEARSITLSDVKILRRQTPTIFEEAAVLKLGSKDRLPLIAYDLDGDGLSELLSPAENVLFLNRGNFQFEKAKLFDFPPGGPNIACVMGDFSGDGRPDMLGSSPVGTAFLWTADEEGRFSTVPKVIHQAKELREPTVITAGDIDADGDLDVWIGQYKNPYRGGQMPTPYYDANDGWPAYMLRNNGNGEFEDVTESCGLAGKRNRRTYSASFADLDDDQDLDLVVVSDFSGIDVYTNDGTGIFTDTTDEMIDKRHAFGMSLSFSDYNADSKLDFYMTGMSSTTAKRLHAMGLGQEEFEEHQSNRPEMGYGNRLYLADGEDFNQAPFNDQVARTGWSWGSTSFDFDNDGDRDLFVANGHKSKKTAKDYCTSFWCHDIYTGSSTPDPELGEFFQMNANQVFGVEGISWNGFEHNALLMNQNGEGFMRIDFLAGVSSELDSRNVLSDDLDGDGRVDLVVVSREPMATGQFVSVLQNKNDTNANWIGVRLEGSSRPLLGAHVKVTTPSQTHVAAIVAGDSYVSQHAPMAHFGMGDATQVDQIEITWPDGASVKVESPEINRYHQIQAADIITSTTTAGL